FYGPGLSYDSGDTTAQVEAGPGSLRFNTPGQKEFSGILGHAGISRRVMQRGHISLNGSRDLDFSLYAFNNYYIIDRLSGTIDYSATRRLTLRFISQYGIDSYEVRVPLLPLRRDTI